VYIIKAKGVLQVPVNGQDPLTNVRMQMINEGDLAVVSFATLESLKEGVFDIIEPSNSRKKKPGRPRKSKDVGNDR